MADATPQVTITASTMLSTVGPAVQMPGIVGALEVLPAGSTLTGGSSSVTGAASSVVPAGATSGLSGAQGTGAASSVVPAGAASGLSGGPG